MTAFALGDVLSVTTDRLVSRDHIDGVYRILNYMTGDSLYTHQLPRAAQECKPALLAQHPRLLEATAKLPDEFRDKAHVYEWLAEQERVFGETLDIDPLVLKQGDYSNPIEDLCDMVGPEKVFVFSPEAREGDQ